MTLSPAQIAQYAAAAGFSGDDLITAVAIALAESNGGNPNAYNSEPQDVPGKYGRTSSSDGKGSYGLWQIYLAAHPEFAGANLLDPQTNAAAAYSVYSAGGFHPWSTFSSGQYGMYETPAVLALAAPSPGAGTPLTLDAATGQPVTDAAPPVFSSIPSPGMYAAVDPSLLLPAPAGAPSWGQILLWGVLGVAALWIVSEV